jgi:hypothetical protein
MNGRAYDYQLGRFLSVDPFIQGTSSDAINPYSYIGNNPLSGTDPSGYISTKEGTTEEKVNSATVKEGDQVITGKDGTKYLVISETEAIEIQAVDNGKTTAFYSKGKGIGITNTSSLSFDKRAMKGASYKDMLSLAWDLIKGGGVISDAVKKVDDQYFGSAPVAETLGAGETISGTVDGIVAISQGNPSGLIQSGGTILASKTKVASAVTDALKPKKGKLTLYGQDAMEGIKNKKKKQLENSRANTLETGDRERHYTESKKRSEKPNKTLKRDASLVRRINNFIQDIAEWLNF